MIVPLQLIEESFVFTGIIVGMGCVTGIIMEWMKYRGKNGPAGKEAMNRLDEIAERLARLDTSMDAVSIEVERISEAQRFTSKLLAERGAQSPAPIERGRVPGSTTPH